MSAKTILSDSADVADRARELYGVTKNIEVVPLGIPEPSFQDMMPRENVLPWRSGVCFISTGRLVKRKGYDILLMALSEALRSAKDLRLVIIGSGPEETSLKDLAAKLGIKDSVFFTGEITDDEKFKSLSAADCFVLSSLHEGFGLAVLEAMACGLAVIAANEGGQRDILKDGRNCVFVRPGDVAALRDAILKLASGENERRSMSQNNRNDFANFTIERTAEKYTKIVQEHTKTH